MKSLEALAYLDSTCRQGVCNIDELTDDAVDTIKQDLEALSKIRTVWNDEYIYKSRETKLAMIEQILNEGVK